LIAKQKIIANVVESNDEQLGPGSVIERSAGRWQELLSTPPFLEASQYPRAFPRRVDLAQ
jgi:hypothetical protein